MVYTNVYEAWSPSSNAHANAMTTDQAIAVTSKQQASDL